MNHLAKQKIKTIDIFLEWTQQMTMHGFPNIFRAKYYTVRIMWIFFFLISNGCCFYIIVINVINFFNYEVVTSIKLVEKDSIPFPAVTVCNANPFVTEEGLKYVENLLQENNISDRILESIYKENSSFLYFTYVRYLSTLLSKGNSAEFLKKLSFPYEQMFLSCLYNFQPCDRNDWYWFYDLNYGNCFRFNTGKDSKGKSNEIKHSFFAGKYNGLMVELFVGIPENENTLSISTGAHIYIDDNLFKPQLGYGLGVAPGESTNLAIERIVNYQLSKPYSECIKNVYSLDSFDSEVYKRVIRSNSIYRQSDCYDAFYISEIYKKCNCEPIFNSFDVEFNKSCKTFEKLECMGKVSLEIQSSDLKNEIKSSCPLECDSVSFRVSKSENRYPSESYGNFLLKNDRLKSLFENRSNFSSEELGKNILAANLYYEYLKQTEISQKASITWDGLVGIIGGTLGLFLGISVLSFAEFIDLFFQIIFKKFLNNNTKISFEN